MTMSVLGKYRGALQATQNSRDQAICFPVGS